MKAVEALAHAARLEAIGVTIRSPELHEEAKRIAAFYQGGGNRAMRRAAARRKRKA